MRVALLRINCLTGLRCSMVDNWAVCACWEEDGWGVDVSTGIAGESTGVREEASGEVIPESLLCILDRFGSFVDEIDRNASIGNGKESCSCCTWAIQVPGALFHETLVEIVILMIRRYIVLYHCGERSFFRVIIDKVISMNSFDNRSVFIVLNLIGGIGDTLGNSKWSKSPLLKFLAACKV